ncbi:MAG TPA: nucleotide sugar dehydrogenase, partial [Longimicrobiaceae bacterium]|nr:nucleotide sugar dehydrogenase [Longimicrobiaceae bacterium]
MNIVVVGAGKMGLPLACQFAQRGGRVTACDVSRTAVDAINAGECPIDEPGVPELLAGAVAAGTLRASTDTADAVSRADAVVVIVPALLTPDRHADLSILESVSRQIATTLRPGTLVSYETTVPVGTTRERFLPLLEESGLRAGSDFSLVFSPERVKSQLVLAHLTGTPKVVGGVDAASAARGSEFYARYLGAPVTDVGTLEAAELVKLAGMLYRDVNIALSNELARYAERVGIELGPVIEAANTDGEAYLLRPGIGVGGHCTPVYPYFLIHDGHARGVPMTLAERARRINDGQAAHALDRVERRTGPLRGRRVLLLGLGFRPQVKEHLFSPAFVLGEVLAARGAEVRLADPLYTGEEIERFGFVPGHLDGEWSPEVLVLNTAHAAFGAPDFAALAARGLVAAVDGRSAWDPGRVQAAGVEYLGIGWPDPAEAAPDGRIPVARPVLAGAEAEAAAEAVRSGWILQGPRVEALEEEFAAYVGAPHACAVSSGTAALHLALLAAGVGPGDEVVTVSHSFIATANSVRYCGATPVFVDIEPDTFNLDPAAVERALTPRTRAILCVHQLGMPCDLAALV